jgi:hypothetical protein
MLKHLSLLASVSALAAITSACGSSDGGDDENGSGGSNGAAGSLNLGANGSGGSLLGGGKHDGGTVDLTADQVEAIQDSACTGWSTEGEALPAVLELVVDVSGSMEKPAPGAPNQSKWTVTRDALSGAIDSLGAQTAVGALYYPNRQTSASTSERDVTACVNTDAIVDIAPLGAPGSAARTALQRSLTRANTGSGTPTHDAYQFALTNGMQAYQSSASKFMLLITDGQPTFSLGCVGTGNVTDPVDEQPIVDAIAAAFNDGIRTFVIGSPGSEKNESSGADARPWLSRAAKAGGTDVSGCTDDGPNFCHLDMTEEPDFAAALSAGLGAIAGQINTCTYSVPPPPDGQEIDLSKVNLIVTAGDESQLVLPDDMGDCSEGWQLNADQQIVYLHARATGRRRDGQAAVRLRFWRDRDPEVVSSGRLTLTFAASSATPTRLRLADEVSGRSLPWQSVNSPGDLGYRAFLFAGSRPRFWSSAG